jgi:hypothetical protein
MLMRARKPSHPLHRTHNRRNALKRGPNPRHGLKNALTRAHMSSRARNPAELLKRTAKPARVAKRRDLENAGANPAARNIKRGGLRRYHAIAGFAPGARSIRVNWAEGRPTGTSFGRHWDSLRS